MSQEFPSSDYAIKQKYYRLFWEIRNSLIGILDDIDNVENRNRTVVHSLDFYHMYDYLWHDGAHPGNYIESANLWTMKSIHDNPPINSLNLVASRGTVLELCDSLHHEIERLSAIRSNPSALRASARKIYEIRNKFEQKNDYTYNHASYIEFFSGKLLELGIYGKYNIQNVNKLFSEKKIQSYYDLVPIDEIVRARPEINRYTSELLSKHKTYKSSRREDRDPVDDEFHRRVDARNLAIAATLSRQQEGMHFYHVTPSTNFVNDDTREYRQSILKIAYYMMSCLSEEHRNSNNLLIPDAKFIYYLHDKSDFVMEQLTNRRYIPDFLLEEMTLLRKMLLSIFNRKSSEMTRYSTDTRMRLLRAEGTERNVKDTIDETIDGYESAARNILASEAHMIDESILYDCDLVSNERATYLIKKYS